MKLDLTDAKIKKYSFSGSRKVLNVLNFYIHLQIARGWHPDVAKFMLEQGANINKCDSYGRSPLHLAAAVDYGEMVQFLIENGGE